MTPVLPDMTNYVARMGGGAYAQAIALWNMAYSIGMFIGPVLGGFLMEHYSFFYSMVAFAVALLAIAPLLASADETITSSQAAQRRMSYGTIDTLEDHEDIAAV
jgi:MFS family permease